MPPSCGNNIFDRSGIPLNRGKIKQLLKILKAQHINDHHEWVMFSCLMASHKHKGKDETASAGISITSGGHSAYHCFGCGTTGDLTGVLLELLVLNRQQGIESPHIAKALEYMDEEDIFVYDADEYSDEAKKGFNPFPDNWLNSFASVYKSPVAMDYLANRKVPLKVIEDFDLRFDHAKQAIGFPYYSAVGKIAGMRGRIIDPMSKIGHYDYSYDNKNNTHCTWFREDKLDAEKPLVVVEGQFDCARVYQAYRNTTAILTAFPTEDKFEKLLYFPEIIWFTDNDAAGKESTLKAIEFFHGKRPLHVVQYQEGDPKDPDGLNPKMLKYYLSEYVNMDEIILDVEC